MFVESTSFIASAATDIGVVNAGAAALTFLVVATPVGWVGLVIERPTGSNLDFTHQNISNS